MSRAKIHLVFLIYITSLIFSCGEEKSQSNHKQTSESNNIFRIYLVRHAQAYKNITPLPDLPPERLDSLTPEGEKQADALGNFLKDKSIKTIYSSPTGRTRQTAEILAQNIGLKNPIIVDKSFASLIKGTTLDGKKVTWSWRTEQWKKGRDPRPNGGESFEDGQKRAVKKLVQLAKNKPDMAIVVVTHGDICSAVLAYANGSTITSAYEENRVDTGSLNEIIISNGECKVLRMNLMP